MLIFIAIAIVLALLPMVYSEIMDRITRLDVIEQFEEKVIVDKAEADLQWELECEEWRQRLEDRAWERDAAEYAERCLQERAFKQTMQRLPRHLM